MKNPKEEINNYNKVLSSIKEAHNGKSIDVFSTDDKIRSINLSVITVNEKKNTLFTMSDTEFVEEFFSDILKISLMILDTWKSNIENGRGFPSVFDLP